MASTSESSRSRLVHNPKRKGHASAGRCDGNGDRLGPGTVTRRRRVYRLFQDARAFVRSLELKNQLEWQAFCKGMMPSKGLLPADIPAVPKRIYVDKGWTGMGDWLGTGIISNRHREYRSFQEARAFVRSLELKNQFEWHAFCNGMMPSKGLLPADIPATAWYIYADKGWNGMGDWLGKGNISNRFREYRSFQEAREFVQSLELKNCVEWRAFCEGRLAGKGRMPKDIPASPYHVYADKGWKGFGDWLGTGTISNRYREYRSFQEARAFARNLGLKSRPEWEAFCSGRLTRKGRLPADIPASPYHVYADKGWKGFGDWLGTGNISLRLREYRPFAEAREFVRKLDLKNVLEWQAFCKGMMPSKGRLPADIPVVPKRIYVDKGWKGMGDWLGTGTISNRFREYRSFQEARAFVQSLELKGSAEWSAFCRGRLPHKGRLPADISASPHRVYADKGWKGMADWLGTGRIRLVRALKKEDQRPLR